MTLRGLAMGAPDELVLESPPAAEAGAGGTGYARAAHDYGHLGVSRETFFRWKRYGVAQGDLPPFDEPHLLEGWYERMRLAQVFKNRFPSAMQQAIAVHLGGSVPVAAAAAPEVKVVRPPVPGPVANAGEQGLAFELEQMRQRVASLRQARDEAYAKEDRINGDQYDRSYREAFNDLTIAEKRALEVLSRREELVMKSAVESDLATRISGIVVGGMFLFGRIAPQLEAARDPAERIALWKAFWREHCGALLQARFAPEWVRRAPEHLWNDCAAWIEGQVPPPLTLAA